MADTTPDCTPVSNQPDRYIVLSDGETWGPLEGSKIIAISADLEGDDIDAAIKARCQDNDAEQDHDDDDDEEEEEEEEDDDDDEDGDDGEDPDEDDEDERLAAGITVLYTAHGYEPGLKGAQTTMPLSGAVAVVAGAPTPSAATIGERRTVVIEFLGHKGALSDDQMDVADLLERASTEDLLADVKATIVEPLDGPTLAQLAKDARSTSDFFGLAEDGTSLDDEL
jgi:hypothetical protein